MTEKELQRGLISIFSPALKDRLKTIQLRPNLKRDTEYYLTRSMELSLKKETAKAAKTITHFYSNTFSGDCND